MIEEFEEMTDANAGCDDEVGEWIMSFINDSAVWSCREFWLIWHAQPLPIEDIDYWGLLDAAAKWIMIRRNVDGNATQIDKFDLHKSEKSFPLDAELQV